MGDLAGLLPVPVDEDRLGPLKGVTGEMECAIELKGRASSVGQAQGVLLSQVPEGLPGGKGLGLKISSPVGDACLGFGDPGGFLIDHSLDLSIGCGSRCAHDQQAIGGDFQSERFSI